MFSLPPRLTTSFSCCLKGREHRWGSLGLGFLCVLGCFRWLYLGFIEVLTLHTAVSMVFRRPCFHGRCFCGSHIAFVSVALFLIRVDQLVPGSLLRGGSIEDELVDEIGPSVQCRTFDVDRRGDRRLPAERVNAARAIFHPRGIAPNRCQLACRRGA